MLAEPDANTVQASALDGAPKVKNSLYLLPLSSVGIKACAEEGGVKGGSV